MTKKYVSLFFGIGALFVLSACAPTWAQAQYRQQPGFYQSERVLEDSMPRETPRLDGTQNDPSNTLGNNNFNRDGMGRDQESMNQPYRQESNWNKGNQYRDRYGFDSCMGSYSPGNGAGRWQDRGNFPSPAQAVSFRYDVQPILNERCVSCHGGTEGLYLDTYSGVMNGSKEWPVIIPGDPSNSHLIWLVTQNMMPFDGPPLSQPEVQFLIDWIGSGAPNN